MNTKKTYSLKLRKGFFGVLIVVVAVVFVWRGVWNLIDMYVFPNDPLLSSVVSILIGLGILYLPDHDIKELV